MAVRLNPYLSFEDSAREAMTFYQSVLGGELTISTFAELHASDDPAEQDKVMHSQLETPDGLQVYFHEHAVVGPAAFDALALGDEVRFEIAEGEGEKGPQASTVRRVRPRRARSTTEAPVRR